MKDLASDEGSAPGDVLHEPGGRDTMVSEMVEGDAVVVSGIRRGYSTVRTVPYGCEVGLNFEQNKRVVVAGLKGKKRGRYGMQ